MFTVVHYVHCVFTALSEKWICLRKRGDFLHEPSAGCSPDSLDSWGDRSRLSWNRNRVSNRSTCLATEWTHSADRLWVQCCWLMDNHYYDSHRFTVLAQILAWRLWSGYWSKYLLCSHQSTFTQTHLLHARVPPPPPSLCPQDFSVLLRLHCPLLLVIFFLLSLFFLIFRQDYKQGALFP